MRANKKKLNSAYGGWEHNELSIPDHLSVNAWRDCNPLGPTSAVSSLSLIGSMQRLHVLLLVTLERRNGVSAIMESESITEISFYEETLWLKATEQIL